MFGRFRQNWKRALAVALGLLIVLFGLMQLVPVDKTNPPVRSEPAWDSPETRALVKAACFDCHSNETVWPWYARIAPSSWLLAHDVEEGRSKLNFSEWTGRQEELDELVEVVREGEMPPWYYAIMHKEAQLSDAEKQALIDGLTRTLGAGQAALSEAGEDD
ncbi:MAG: heme-binding domain-containing protein [Anaerolineae bacterium]